MYCGYKSMFSCNNFKSLTPELLKRIQSCMYNKKNKDEIIPTEIIDNHSESVIAENDITIDSFHNTIPEANENVYLIKEQMLKEITTINNAVEPTTVNESKTEASVNAENIIAPIQKDTLFWCIFILHFGYNEYLQVNRNYGIKELEIKQKVIEYLNQHPGVLKQTNYKITKASVQEILSEFLTSQKDTSILCFIAMISYFKMNIIMVDSTNRFMLEFLSNKDENLPTYVLYKDGYGKYKVNIEPIFADNINNMKNTLICLENYVKPLKSASNYKIDDLIDLARKLGIYNENAKIKKNELYEQIYEICKWH